MRSRTVQKDVRLFLAVLNWATVVRKADGKRLLTEILLPTAGRVAASPRLPELEVPASFSPSEVEHWVERIELAPLRAAVRERWANVRS